MIAGGLLHIEPLELEFPFELRKQICCSLHLSNRTDSYVAFKVKTTNPKKYCVRPNTGIVLPHSTCEIIVTMQAQKDAPPDMQCKDKFLLQSVKAPEGSTVKDINAELFNKEAGNVVEESKLRVIYVSPQQPPSPVKEEPEEGSSPNASVSENGTVTTSELSSATKTTGQLSPVDKFLEARTLISRLTKERDNAILQNSRLRQELELLRRESSRNHGGLSLMYVTLVGLLGIALGYILNKI